MLNGIDVCGLHPLGGFPYSDFSVIPVPIEIFASDDIERIFIALLYPYDPVAAAEVEIKLGGDARQLLVAYPDRLIEALDVETRIDIRDGISAGASNLTSGSIVIAIGDAQNDALTQYYWDGRKIEIRVGADTFLESQFVKVFVGAAEDVTFDHDVMSITARDPSIKLDVDLQTNLYSGMGDFGGGPNLKGQAIPICFGECKNISPLHIDPIPEDPGAYLIYQFNDGPVESVDAVYDKRVLLTPANGGNNDITDLGFADITEWPPEGGFWITDLANGLLRLGAPPFGTMTADVKGDNADGTLGYVNTAADIIQRVVTGYGPLADSDLLLSSFATLNIDQPGVQGIYINQGGVSAIDVVDQVLASILGFRTHDSSGLLTVGRIADPAGSTPTITFTEENILDGSLRRQQTGAPFHQVTVAHTRNWTVQDDDAVAATAVEPDFAKEEYRRSIAEDSIAVQAEHLLARTLEDETLFISSSDATTEATRRLGLLKPQRDVYQFSARGVPFQYSVGQVIRLQIPRFGLDAGRNFVILAVGESSTTYSTFLEVWG